MTQHATEPPLPVPHRARSRWWPVAILGCTLGLVSTAGLFMMIRGQTLPTLDQQKFDAAVRKWEAVAPDNYDIETRVQGRQPAVYRVQVRERKVVLATHNGNPLKQVRTWGTWSVPGMFGTIESDVEKVQRVTQGTADASTPRLLLKAQFHPHWGYPQKYRRLEWGSHVEVNWEVTHFEVLPSPPSTEK